MLDRVQLISNQSADDCLWLLEHYDVYTKGPSLENTNQSHINNIPIIESDRGGKYTYHGPGQRILYTILNLNHLYGGKPDIRRFIYDIANIIIQALEEIGLKTYLDLNTVGIWHQTKSGDKKIASIGLKIKKWVVYHGIAINVNPDMSKFDYISPCGLESNIMTSLSDLGIIISTQELDRLILKNIADTWSDLKYG